MDKGSIINDRYEIICLLGQGGMGTVFKVYDFVESRVVALKLIREKIFSDKAINRFKNEFKIVTNLKHDNIIEVYDFDIYKKTDTYFITMEYVDGENLSDAFNHLDKMEKYKILLQIARGLNYIHSRQIIHFDIKPDNIFLLKENGDYLVKIMDFGLASLLVEFTGKVRGTLSYIAPEIILKKKVDFRVDLYSLGMVIYHIFSNKLPFEDYTSVQAIAKAKSKESFLQEDAFNNLEEDFLKNLIIDLCRANREDRVQSAQQLINLLETAIELDIKISDKKTAEGFNDEYYDKRGLVTKLQDDYLNFCLRGEKRSGKLTVIVGEKGSGRSRMLNMFSIKAQLNRIPTLFFPVKQEEKLINIFFRKIIFGLISFLEKNDKTAVIFKRARKLVNENGEFVTSENLYFEIKDILREIYENIKITHSLIIIVDDIYNFSERDRDLFLYILHLSVVSPIFMLVSIDKDKTKAELIEKYEEIFYLIPPERIEIENLNKEEILDFISILLNVNKEDIDSKLLPSIISETSGNILLIKNYIQYLLDNGFLIYRNNKYIYNNFSGVSYSFEIDKIFIDRLNNLNTDDKTLLFFITERLNKGESIKIVNDIFPIKNLEATLLKLQKLNIIDYRVERGRKDYFVKNESFNKAIKYIFNSQNMKKFYDKMAAYFVNKNRKSVYKFAYSFIRSSAPEADKIEILEKALDYCRFSFKEIELKNFLVYYYNNFKISFDKKLKILKELYVLLIWTGNYDEAFVYYSKLFQILEKKTENYEFATLLTDSACFSGKKIPLAKRLVNLFKASDLFIKLGKEKDYADSLYKGILLMFRSGNIDRCVDHIKIELKKNENLISEKIKDKLNVYLHFFKSANKIKESKIYHRLVEIYKHLEADYVSPREKEDLIQVILLNLIVQGRYKMALGMIQPFIKVIDHKNDNVENTVLYFIYATLLEKIGKLSKALEIYVKIENLAVRKKGINGLLSILIYKLGVIINMKEKKEEIKAEFNRAISISKRLQNFDSLLSLYARYIEFLTSSGEWRDVDIYIKFGLNILERVVDEYKLREFADSSVFYYYIIKDDENLFYLLYQLKQRVQKRNKDGSYFDKLKIMTVPFSREVIEELLERISVNSNDLEYQYMLLVKYLHLCWINFNPVNNENVIKICEKMMYKMKYSPSKNKHLEIVKNLLQENFEESIDKTVAISRVTFARGYVFDCYYPILSSLCYFKHKSMYKNAMFFEKKLEKLNSRLASKLSFDKRDDFINKYWKY